MSETVLDVPPSTEHPVECNQVITLADSTWSRRTEPSQFTKSQEIMYHYKPLSFGVMCFVATDNCNADLAPFLWPFILCTFKATGVAFLKYICEITQIYSDLSWSSPPSTRGSPNSSWSTGPFIIWSLLRIPWDPESQAIQVCLQFLEPPILFYTSRSFPRLCSLPVILFQLVNSHTPWKFRLNSILFRKSTEIPPSQMLSPLWPQNNHVYISHYVYLPQTTLHFMFYSYFFFFF